MHKLHKQLGNKIIEFSNGQINGYTITEYDHKGNYINYAPTDSMPRPDRVLSFDGAYDLLFGVPSAPDFTKLTNIQGSIR
jgi:hypothetical protein